MSKIICDICGTTYPSSAESCPICGFNNKISEDILNVDINLDDVVEETVSKPANVAPVAKKKEIFDFDEVNSEEEIDDEEAEMEDEEDDENEYYEEDDEEESGHNVFVVILLTVLIVALLGAAGFIFVRYFLPNMGDKKPVETVPVAATETLAPTTEPTIPCDYMTMTNAGVAELSAEGQQFLLHVRAIPDNTTDKIIYTSGNENVATVTEDGKITAVSEGETIVYISCGKYSIECPVIVKYVEETVPPTTEAVVEETIAETEPPVDAEGDAKTEATVPAETSAPSNVTLKLKKTDIQLGVYYEFQLELDCELNQEDVTWTSEHPHIAKVDESGNVTALKEGTTSITAKYGDQEVQCMVRCGWY